MSIDRRQLSTGCWFLSYFPSPSPHLTSYLCHVACSTCPRPLWGCGHLSSVIHSAVPAWLRYPPVSRSLGMPSSFSCASATSCLLTFEFLVRVPREWRFRGRWSLTGTLTHTHTHPLSGEWRGSDIQEREREVERHREGVLGFMANSDPPIEDKGVNHMNFDLLFLLLFLVPSAATFHLYTPPMFYPHSQALRTIT